MEGVFWVTLVVVVYIYLGYPALVWLLGSIRTRVVRQRPYTPFVTIVIAAYNEEKHIAATLHNKVSLDYPRDRLEIIVVSDESSDRTDSIVQECATTSGANVNLIRQSPRRGKTSALNLAVPQAQGEIIVFSDANSIYDRHALRLLTRNFADPRVGYVTGKMVYVTREGSIVGDGCSAFMKYENFLRFYESRLNSVVGVDGGIDAVRKSLYEEMRPDQLPDFVLPLSVVKKRHRVVYEPEAILKEEALTESRDEYRMRVRVGLRAFWALYDMRVLFNPFRYGVYSWQLLSHKALRYAAFFPLGLLLISNLVLLNSHRGVVLYQIAFAAQFALYGLAVTARVLERNGIGNPMSAFAYYFSLINIASAHAFVKFMRGEKQSIWKPRTG
jgi:cellulose synthase/poly-beta-1,6-N-acetylglucosamine synthase-like glycosyltransferase